MLIERLAYDQPEATVESKVNTVPSAHQAYTQAKNFPEESIYACVCVHTHTNTRQKSPNERRKKLKKKNARAT